MNELIHIYIYEHLLYIKSRLKCPLQRKERNQKHNAVKEAIKIEKIKYVLKKCFQSSTHIYSNYYNRNK